MTDTAPLPPTLMAHHTAALRRLARQLVGNPDEAEDALQETWLRALEAPPRTTHRLRAWLETVLRNVVRRRARQRARLHSREQAAARREATAATVDVVAHRQTLRALTDAVLALRPGWQELVFARYFEGLPPREIARRDGRDVAAVHRDLERARAELRRRLAERLGGRGDWRGPLAALCGLSLPRAAALGPPGLVAGGVILAMKKQLVFALCAACAVALVWIAEPGEPSGATPPAPKGTPPATPVVAAAVDAPEEPPQRSEVPALPPAVGDALAPYRFAVEIHTRDEDDLPVPGAKITIGPEHHELNTAVAGDDGVLRLSWRGRAPSMALVFGSADDLSQGKRLRRLELTAGTTAVAPLRLKRRGPRHLDVVLFRVVGGNGGGNLVVASQQPPPVEIDDEGTAWFVTRGTTTGEESQQSFNVVFDTGAFHGVRSGTFTLNAEVVGHATVSGGAESAATGSVKGVVRDARGQPAADVLVQVGPDREQRSPWWARTGEDGSFTIEKVPVGSLQLRAGGGDRGLAFATVEIAAGQETAWMGTLDRGLELSGRLVDKNGAPLAKWRIEARPHGETGTWIDGAVTDAAGRFAIPNVTQQPYTLRMCPEYGVVHGFRLDGVWPGVDQSLAVPGAELGDGALRTLPVRPDGTPCANVELRLWLDGFDEGVRSTSDDAQRPREVDHLCPGLYTVTAGGTGVAHRDVAQLVVAAGSPTDLGAVPLPEPSVLALPDELDVGEAKFSLLRLHDAVPSRAGALDGHHRKLLLPAGKYLVRDGDIDREVELEAGPNTFEPHRAAK